MPTGRKPRPLKLVDNGKARHTNNELDERENGEPGGCSAELKPIKSLSKAARKEWKRVIKLYRELDAPIINDLDIAVLAAYCESVAIYQQAEADYQKGPLVYRTPEGKTMENPYISIMRREGQNIIKYAEQLCLSPVGRARMGVAAAKKAAESDPMAAYLSRYGG